MKQGHQIKPKEKKIRVRRCLRCDRPFKSEGPWQRLCPACRQYATENAYEEEEFRFGYM